MRPVLAALVLALGLAPQLPGSAQELTPQLPQGPRLQLTFEGDGRVTLISNGATLQEILREWTAKGGTPFVGAERLSGAGMMLQYNKQTETDVLRSLLRSASGLILAPRREGGPVGASQFEAVYVLATSNATASTSFSPTYTTNYSQPTVSTTGNPSTEVPPVGAGGAAGAATAGAPGAAGPGPQPPQQAAPPEYPSAQPAGVRPVAISIVPVPSTTSSTTSTPPPTPPPANTPPPTTTGRGGGGGGGGGIR